MSCRGDSDEDSRSKRRVSYVYSPEYIEACDTLSKVPNRVSWIELAALLKLINTVFIDWLFLYFPVFG